MFKNVKDEILVKLNEIVVGKRKLRYLHVPLSVIPKHGENSQECSEDPISEESPSCLLFLGGDILSNTIISTKNMARQHLKLSKGNNCCKLILPYRLAGVAGHTKVAWFYDIHGFIKTVFEFYEVEEQIIIMQYFFSLWSTTKRMTLPVDIQIKEDDLIMKKLVLSILVNNIDNCAICEKNKHAVLQNRKEKSSQCNVETVSFSSQTKSTVKNDSNTQTPITAGCVFKQSVAMDIEGGACNSKITKMLTKDKFEPNVSNIMDSDDSKIADQKYSNSYSPFKDFSSINDSRMSLILISTLTAHLQRFFQQASSNIIFYKIYSLLEIFLSLLHEEVTHIEKSNTGIFPFHLLVEYSNVKKAYKEQKDIPLEIYYQECVLGIVSKWLANQFHDFQTVILSQVENFKQEQMRQNKTILDPVELLSQHDLFPSYMIEFLSQWVGSYETDNEKKFICSRIVLVLELLNDSLITGMGHVVYAKLKCNYSM